MKTIGLIGGMSWESSAIYYRIINQKTKEILGDLHSAKSIMYTVDFEEIAGMQRNGDWADIGKSIANAALSLQNAGADFVLICCNTQYKVAADIESAIDIPLIHIGDATADAVQAAGFTNVVLLGTRYTMEHDFIKDRFTRRGMEVVTPDAEGREVIQQIIYTELAKGVINPASLQSGLAIINKLVAGGAQAVVLGCTELGMLFEPGTTEVPLFDTTMIHAEKAVELALADDFILS